MLTQYQVDYLIIITLYKMKYKTEDGNEILSEPGKEVIYRCDSEFNDGIYTSYETEGAATELGIRQIKIVRKVENKECTYTITESTEEELKQYLNSIK